MARSRMIAAMLTVLAPGAAWAQALGEADRFGPHMWWWGGGWYGMILGPLFMILMLALLIASIVLLARWIGGAPAQPPPRTALDILKERFARGEIDKEEFEERRRLLGD